MNIHDMETIDERGYESLRSAVGPTDSIAVYRDVTDPKSEIIAVNGRLCLHKKTDSHE